MSCFNTFDIWRKDTHFHFSLIVCKGLFNYDERCCSPKKQCGHDEGDCDGDNECAGDLVCGHNNCPLAEPLTTYPWWRLLTNFHVDEF